MLRRTKKACQVCGRPFHGSTDCNYCPVCAKEKKADTVVKSRKCQDCGIEFFGGPRAKRCPDCAYMAKVHRERKPTMRPIGGVDRCAVCGQEYIVVSGRQKYCSDECQREGVLAWQRERKKGYAVTSGQDVKKQERRQQSRKICVYCLREFSSNTATNTCSDFCKKEQQKLIRCTIDIRRGRSRNLKKYEDMREKYREECKK